MGMKKPKVQPIKDWETIEFDTDIPHYEWCCDCGLRHIVLYSIIKRGKKLKVGLKATRDDWGTWAGRKLK
jgi:hypothetical protein